MSRAPRENRVYKSCQMRLFLMQLHSEEYDFCLFVFL